MQAATAALTCISRSKEQLWATCETAVCKASELISTRWRLSFFVLLASIPMDDIGSSGGHTVTLDTGEFK